MTADGVMPHHARVAEIGRVVGADGKTLTVAVNGDMVTINGVPLNLDQCETLARLWVRACWLAGHDPP